MKSKAWLRVVVIGLVALIAAVVSVGVGCSSTTGLANGVAPCAASADCPSDYHCAPDSTCWRDGSDPANDASADACTGSVCAGLCVDTASDRANCGTCGAACAAGELCSKGHCALSCGGGASLCDGGCHDTKSDPRHCGACGKACSAGLVCSQGACALTCAGGTTNCSGACVSTKTDVANCGACGKACAGGSTCASGVCTTTCGGEDSLCTPKGAAGDAGADAGAPYCANLKADRTNCGVCGATCAVGLVCSVGGCQLSCQANLVSCAGSCIDPLTSRAYCGATDGCGEGGVGSAGSACASGQVCASGTCQVSCPNAQTNCGGVCIDPLTSRTHCGATAGCGAAGGSAGAVCNSGNVCSNGTCKVSCPGTQIDCGGVCVDPQTSLAYCGATAGCGVAGGSAGTACAAGMVCGNGVCAVSCPGSQISCGGICVDPFTSRSNCGATGACGVGGGSAGAACAAGSVCANGTCAVSCPGLQINCGGTCIDPLTSRSNCGATSGCGAAGGSAGATCTNGNVCSNGSCQVSCPGSQISCGGTCIDPLTSRSNCGATAGCGVAGGSAGTACTNGNVCSGGSCQVSCPGSEINCGGSCIDRLTSPTNCGATAGCGGPMGGSAGTTCAAGTVCTSGTCQASCLAPLIACSGSCIDPRFDPGHCGSCNACPAVPNAVDYCLSSTCGIASCSGSFLDCNRVFADGCEANKLTDNKNCGACGNACGAGTVCTNGACAAQPTSCLAIHTAAPASPDGKYTIDPDGPGGAAPFSVYCDMTTNGGGWTLTARWNGNLGGPGGVGGGWTHAQMCGASGNIRTSTTDAANFPVPPDNTVAAFGTTCMVKPGHPTFIALYGSNLTYAAGSLDGAARGVSVKYSGAGTIASSSAWGLWNDPSVNNFSVIPATDTGSNCGGPGVCGPAAICPSSTAWNSCHWDQVNIQQLYRR